MKIARHRWNSDKGWHGDTDLPEANLVLAFGDHDHFHSHACYAELRQRFPKAHIAGCSSSGNVAGTTITDRDVVATAIQLERGTTRMVSGTIEPGADRGHDLLAMPRHGQFRWIGGCHHRRFTYGAAPGVPIGRWRGGHGARC